MNDLSLTILILSIVAAVALVAFFRQRKNAENREQQIIDSLPIALPEAYAIATTTPLGALVHFERLFTPAEMALALDAIDIGISQMLRSTVDKGFNSYRRHTDFHYILLTPTAVSSGGYPSLKTKGGLLIGGITLGLEEPYEIVMVLPQQVTHLDYLTAGARHESEHIAAYFNDREFYEQTKRPENHIHPFYP